MDRSLSAHLGCHGPWAGAVHLGCNAVSSPNRALRCPTCLSGHVRPGILSVPSNSWLDCQHTPNWYPFSHWIRH